MPPKSPRRKTPPRLRLRRATLADGERLLAWRNDRETRRQSFNQDVIPLARHLDWLRAKLADADSRLYIAIDASGSPVAQMRLERAGQNGAEVHIAVAPEARGRGVARVTLGLAAKAARRTFGVATLIAHVRPENLASVIAFVKAGFRFRRLTKIKGSVSYQLELPLAPP